LLHETAMQKEIRVFDRTETVTVAAGSSPGTHRVTWEPSHGGPVEHFELTATGADTVEQALAKELGRRRYHIAYTTYLSCLETLADASQRGESPSAEALKNEADAFNELTSTRQAFLDALSNA
jgi:hypothetical protein